jgi:uncharacterized delta-60 repeat protein
MKKIFTFLLLLVAIGTQAQQLITDTSFGITGQIATAPIGGNGPSTNILRQPDNKLLLCGNMYDNGCNCHYNLMFRVDCAGKVDSAFGVNGLVKHTFDDRNIGEDYVLQPDGKILVAGLQASSNGSSQHHPTISRYNYDGSVDTTFGNMGTNKLTNYPGYSTFYSVFLLPDGKILCSGQQGYGNHLIVRFDSTGAVDNTFGTNGAVQHATPAGMSLLTGFRSVMRSDGKIISVAAGYFNQLLVISAYDTLGIEDASFGTNGYVLDNNFAVWGIARIFLQSDDKLVVAKQNNSETEIRIARYNTNGSIDSAFGTNGYVTFPGARLKNFFKLSDDAFIIGYTTNDFNGNPDIYKKYVADGVEVSLFTIDGVNTFQFPGLAFEKADIGIASSNNEIILATSNGFNNGKMSMAKFVETITPEPHITLSGNILNANVSNSGISFHWFLNGDAILDSTNNSITATQTGTYSVIVTNAWGCEQSDDFEVTTIITGIDKTSAEMLSVYPNPAKDVLHITWTSTDKSASVELLDLTGRVVLSKALNSTNATDINVQQLAKGMYLLKLHTSNFTSTKKIFVE